MLQILNKYERENYRSKSVVTANYVLMRKLFLKYERIQNMFIFFFFFVCPPPPLFCFSCCYYCCLFAIAVIVCRCFEIHTDLLHSCDVIFFVCFSLYLFIYLFTYLFIDLHILWFIYILVLLSLLLRLLLPFLPLPPPSDGI